MEDLVDFLARNPRQEVQTQSVKRWKIAKGHNMRAIRAQSELNQLGMALTSSKVDTQL